MIKINIIGDIFGNSGYAKHTRCLSNALFNNGCDVRLDCALPMNWQMLCNDNELIMIKKDFDHESTTIMISQPQSWPLGISQKPKKFFGFCVWEGDKIPDYWLKFLRDTRVDKILVPSKHTKQAILKSEKRIDYRIKLINKIEIISHGVDLNNFYPDNSLREDKTFTFVANKGWSQGLHDRGGIQWLLKAYCKEFTKKDKVKLIIKINSAYNNPSWNIKDEFDKLEINRKNGAPILTLTENIDDKEMRRLYNDGDVFITTTMADGFNLPPLEAMACGLPVITTPFGGMTDFVNTRNGWMIKKGKLLEWSLEECYRGIKWWKPDIDDICKTMRKIYENQIDVIPKGFEAMKTSRKFIWDNSAKKIIRLI